MQNLKNVSGDGSKPRLKGGTEESEKRGEKELE
jgi:hypothetical protein